MTGLQSKLVTAKYVTALPNCCVVIVAKPRA